MWLSRPVYEFLPYSYMLLGLVALGVSFTEFAASWSTLLLVLGGVLLVLGLVLWLKRRDYRTAQSEYDPRSLDR